MVCYQESVPPLALVQSLDEAGGGEHDSNFLSISNRQRQHLSCIVSMVTDAPRDILYNMKILCRCWKFKDTEKVIRYRPFGIGIGTDIVFGISVPESTAGSTEIPNLIRYSQLWAAV